MTSFRPFSPLCALLAALLATACGGGTFGDPPLDPDDPRRENGFESDNPLGPNASSRGGNSAGAADGDSGAGSSSGGAEPSAPPTDNGGEAERAIEEADIVKVEGTILYALSRFGGLTTIDVSDPARLRLLGRARMQGTPFEMYVRDGRAYVMLNEFGRWVSTTNDAGLEVGGSWQQTSELVALDVSNPRAISEVAHYDIPGTVADSRLVGDAMYVVTYENGYCWGCEQNRPGTVVTSFLLQGASIRKVKQLPFRPNNNSYSYQRSVSATNERLYIGGPDWSWNDNGSNNSRSVIQVVDIADPGGEMALGDSVTVAGQINSRWQMDEHDGVLRVVSQPWNWSVNPEVETFTIHDSNRLTALGSGQLQLPKPESLRSVRFDGARGYAITAEQTDPLFTIDLSDPAHPRQAGELEMPGWITHMEPRGDRLIGFGFADTNWGSKLAVSLFDVSDLSTPVMLDRVEFGGGGGNAYAEDQDRIHKSVQVLTDKGLVLVPFASYRSWDNNGCSESRSGIQLIDFSRDDLTLRGLAPQYGASRRSFFVGDKLLAMGDRNVTAFDVSSRDNPIKLSETDLANPAYQIQRVGNYVASISNDWWTEEATLSLTPFEGADDAAVTGRIDLGAMIRGTAESCQVGASHWTSWYGARIVPLSATTLAVAVPTYWYRNDQSGNYTYGQRLIIGSFDLSDPSAPRLTATKAIEESSVGYGYYGYGYGFADGYGYYGMYGGGLLGTGEAVVAVDQKLAYLGVSYLPTGDVDEYGRASNFRLERKLHVIDYHDMNQPLQHPPMVLGESLGQFPLHVQGSQVLTSRWMASNTPGKVRFYVDRIELAGAVPQRLPSINVPGSLLSIDPQSGRAVTTDYREISFAPQNGNHYDSCWSYGGISWFDESSQRCKHIERQFKLLDIGADGQNVAVLSQFVPNSRKLNGVLATGSTIYLTRYPEYSYSGGVAGSSGTADSSDSIGSSPYTPTLTSPGGFDVITGVRDGNLRQIASHNSGDSWTWPLAATDQHVAMYTQSGVTVFASNEGTPRVAAHAELKGAGYSSDVLLSQDRALCSLGEWGLQTIPLQ